MTLVDALFVGRLGSTALAGFGLGGTLAFTVLCFPFGLLRATKTLVAQSIGGKRSNEADAYLGSGIIAALLLGLATILVGLCLVAFVKYLTATP